MNSTLKSCIERWCQKPDPLWDIATTKLLARYQWELMSDSGWLQEDCYSMAGVILKQPEFGCSKIPLISRHEKKTIYLENPCSIELASFYSKNGLVTIPWKEIGSNCASEKIIDALTLLGVVPNVLDCVALLVRGITVLESTSPETDVSYSHPEAPFSIMVSVCEDRSLIASARVAEAILHETMHLRLSIIQRLIELIRLDRGNNGKYYSPWKSELRPANGVLHGIFVFGAIQAFFRELAMLNTDSKLAEFANQRVKEISVEFEEVEEFHKSDSLSNTGKCLVRQLLKEF